MGHLLIPYGVPSQGGVGVLSGNTDLDYGPSLGNLTRGQRGHEETDELHSAVPLVYARPLGTQWNKAASALRKLSKEVREADIHQIATQIYNYEL